MLDAATDCMKWYLHLCCEREIQLQIENEQKKKTQCRWCTMVRMNKIAFFLKFSSRSIAALAHSYSHSLALLSMEPFRLVVDIAFIYFHGNLAILFIFVVVISRMITVPCAQNTKIHIRKRRHI